MSEPNLPTDVKLTPKELEYFMQQAAAAQKNPIPAPVPIEKLPKEDQTRALSGAMKMIKGEVEQDDFVKSLLTPEAVKPPEVPAATPEAPTTSEPETIDTSHTCANCGFNSKSEPIEATEEDRKIWIESVLGGKPFTKTYPLFNGKFHVTFRSRTVNDNDMIFDQLAQEIKDGRISSVLANEAYHLRLRKLQMTAALLRFEPGKAVGLPHVCSSEATNMYPPKIKSVTNPKDPTIKEQVVTDNTVAIAHEVIFGGWNEILYMAVFRVHWHFEQLVYRLVQNSMNPGFWTEAAGQF